MVFIGARDEYASQLCARFVNINLVQESKKPIRELAALTRIALIYHREKFGLVLHFTPKVNRYGSRAAMVTGVEYIGLSKKKA